MAELARINVRRSATFGAAALAAAALMGLGVGTAAADNYGPSCEASQGPSIDDGVRFPAIQGELRAADDGVVQAQGTVNGDNSRVMGRAVPSGPSWSFGGALVDGTGTTAHGPWTSYHLSEFPNPCG